ncbi:MAG: hypothetical protein B6244_01860 [Candidatus Cloacimonetes bacterium 4572_55]|nr:MAG: hypothetical protein B6244_01860 [Candidatus Cloacimonetes bacterium 4572_55]
MKRCKIFVMILILFPIFGYAQQYNNPESAVFDSARDRYLISNFGERAILQLDANGQLSYFATNIVECIGLHIVGNTVYVGGGTGRSVRGFDLDTGQEAMNVHIPGTAAQRLNDPTSDNDGNLYISDFYSGGGEIYKIQLSDQSVTTFFSGGFHGINGIHYDSETDRILAVCAYHNTGDYTVISINREDPSDVLVADVGPTGLDGVIVDERGNVYFSSWGGAAGQGAIHRFPIHDFSATPELVRGNLNGPADIFYDSVNQVLVTPNFLDHTVDFTDCAQIGAYQIEQIYLDDPDYILEPQESAEFVFRLGNYWGASIATASLTCSDATVSIQPTQIEFPEIPAGGSSDNSSHPFVISTSSMEEPHLAYFTLTLSLNGEQQEMDFQFFLGLGGVLLVDDDDYAEYESYYLNALGDAGEIYHYYDASRFGTPSQELISRFTETVWFTEDAEDQTLTQEDMARLATYLNGGGHLFLTGQNIGDDIGGDAFFADYLHATHVTDEWTGAPLILGVPGDPIGDDIFIQLGTEDGAQYQTLPSVMEPTQDAQKIFGYFPQYLPQMEGCGVRYEGEYRVVYLSYSLGGVNTSDLRVELTTRIMQFLRQGVGVEQEIQELPPSLTIQQNFPNPFRVSTEIGFGLSRSDRVKIQIYDVSGRLVRTLLDETRDPGFHSVTWEGKDAENNTVAPGAYFYSIEANGEKKIGQMTTLR